MTYLFPEKVLDSLKKLSPTLVLVSCGAVVTEDVSRNELVDFAMKYVFFSYGIILSDF